MKEIETKRITSNSQSTDKQIHKDKNLLKIWKNNYKKVNSQQKNSNLKLKHNEILESMRDLLKCYLN